MDDYNTEGPSLLGFLSFIVILSYVIVTVANGGASSEDSLIKESTAESEAVAPGPPRSNVLPLFRG
ncbi:hypothetical protein [Paenibacillus sp. SAFN-117]|uniref:hypothetical protein n=1 Tax=Paenibacillus sp. SAFN-117 TaxID=3436860 RepID=UPI003F820A65